MAESTSEEYSWFNETDRLLQGIVSDEPGRGRAHGQMVVMRVYAKEAQLSLQHCLRQAVEKLNIHDTNKNPLFSVVSDNGDSNTSLTNIEPYFLNQFNLNTRAGDGTYTLRDRLNELQGSRELSYSDLLNVPMILILCDKGRTGDTFPHSLGCFDLRVRTTEQSFATFEQELGRLCRYQAFKPIEGGRCSNAEAIKLGKKASMGQKRAELRCEAITALSSISDRNTHPVIILLFSGALSSSLCLNTHGSEFVRPGQTSERTFRNCIDYMVFVCRQRSPRYVPSH